MADVERFELSSGLRQSLLRDLDIGINLVVDHEGGGVITIHYLQAPPEHRLQALLQVMGALGERIALAVGEETYLDLLRGIVARREGRR